MFSETLKFLNGLLLGNPEVTVFTVTSNGSELKRLPLELGMRPKKVQDFFKSTFGITLLSYCRPGSDEDMIFASEDADLSSNFGKFVVEHEFAHIGLKHSSILKLISKLTDIEMIHVVEKYMNFMNIFGFGLEEIRADFIATKNSDKLEISAETMKFLFFITISLQGNRALSLLGFQIAKRLGLL